METIWNLMLSMFMCCVFALVFLAMMFLGQGVVYALRWLYDRYLWVRWFNRN